MKRNWHHLVVLALMVNLVNSGDPEFSSIQLSRCRKGDNDLQLNGLSWLKCLKACRERPQCLAVSYQLSTHLCVFDYVVNDNIFIRDSKPDVCFGFVFAEKKVWNGVSGQDCGDGAADICPAKECLLYRNLRNGKVDGNMFTIGSKLKVSCNTEFTLVGAAQFICNDYGHWTTANGHRHTEPVCAKDIPAFVSASQTSTGYIGDARLAIDGNVNSDYYNGSCSHTANGRQNDSWSGRLETTSIVRRVVIYNRGDCCDYRLNDISVFVGSKLCARFQGEAGAVVTLTCTAGTMIGDSVTILQNLNYHLTLCEVIVY